MEAIKKLSLRRIMWSRVVYKIASMRWNGKFSILPRKLVEGYGSRVTSHAFH